MNCQNGRCWADDFLFWIIRFLQIDLKFFKKVLDHSNIYDITKELADHEFMELFPWL